MTATRITEYVNFNVLTITLNHKTIAELLLGRSVEFGKILINDRETKIDVEFDRND